jgi:uncharacterized protein (TIGR01319 family)
MSTSLVEADSLLAVDVGAVTTRAVLFDVVNGQYRFLASGSAPTTAGAPFHDVGEGIRLAFDQLRAITGRVIVGPDERLIMPTASDGSGVDTFIATISAGPALKVIVVGLLEDISLASARRLAETTYCKVKEIISLNNRQKIEDQIDTILRLRPDLILVAGGIEGGASQSVIRLLESVGLACSLLPDNLKPEVLFAGNSTLREEVEAKLSTITNLSFAPNVRPALDVEQLDAAQNQVAGVFARIRKQHIHGVKELDEWAGGGLMSTASAFGRMIRFLSKAHPSVKGVLGIDIGASATTLAAAFSDTLSLGVYPQCGLGSGLKDLLAEVALRDIARWVPGEISEEAIQVYIYNKTLYPASLPMTEEEVFIEQAIARQALQTAVRMVSIGFPSHVFNAGPGLLPWFEPIVASGSVLTRAPSLAQTMLILLDGLQPTGVTTIVLDHNHLISALGAAAALNSILSIQVLESNALLTMGTVITPVSNTRPGTPILRIKMTDDNGQETTLDIKQGTLEVVPLPTGRTANLHLTPLHRADVGMGAPGRSGKLKVVGGALGLVIDARGRPLTIPDDPQRRQELFKKWIWTLGG